MIRSVLDREMIPVLRSILAKERREPIHIRLVSPHIGDFDIDGEDLLERLVVLRAKKNAAILLLIDRREYYKYVKQHGSPPTEIEKLEDFGVRVQKIRGLHAKIAMVENKQEKCLLVTSANLSHTAYHKSHEAGIYIQNESEDIYDSFEEYIRRLLVNASR